MDTSAAITAQEIIRVLLGGTIPLIMYLVGKFIFNRWEIRRLEAQTIKDDIQNEKDRVELAKVYKEMAEEAAQEAIAKSDSVLQLQQKVLTLSIQVAELTLDIVVLRKEKEALALENLELNKRIVKLETALEDNKIPIPNGKKENK